jgi:protein TonB
MTEPVAARLTGATALGAGVTALVLLLMQTLIESEDGAVETPEPAPALNFVRLLEDEPVDGRPERPEPPPEPDQPPPPPRLTLDDDTAPLTVASFTPPESGPTPGPRGAAMSEGEALPIVKVRPVYPRSAISRGIEGHVLVRFTIDTLGRVTDVEVLEARPRGVFERAAVQAVERFRYKPRVVNGQATPVSVQHRLTFELDS